MAGDDVSLSPNELRNNARHVADFASRFDSLTQKILGRANSEDGKWGGSKDGQQFAGGGNGYIAQLKWVSGVFDGQSKTLHSFSDAIRDTADVLEQQDDDDSSGQSGTTPSGLSNGGSSGSAGSTPSKTLSNPNKTKTDQPEGTAPNQTQQPGSKSDSAFVADNSGQSPSPSDQQDATSQPASASEQPASQSAPVGPTWAGSPATPTGPPTTPTGLYAAGQATASATPLGARTDSPTPASETQLAPSQTSQQPNQGSGQSGSPASGGSPRSTPPASSSTPPSNPTITPKSHVKSSNSAMAPGGQGPTKPSSAASLGARPIADQPGHAVSGGARVKRPDHTTGAESDRRPERDNLTNDRSPSTESVDDAPAGRGV